MALRLHPLLQRRVVALRINVLAGAPTSVRGHRFLDVAVPAFVGCGHGRDYVEAHPIQMRDELRRTRNRRSFVGGEVVSPQHVAKDETSAGLQCPAHRGQRADRPKPDPGRSETRNDIGLTDLGDLRLGIPQDPADSCARCISTRRPVDHPGRKVHPDRFDIGSDTKPMQQRPGATSKIQCPLAIAGHNGLDDAIDIGGAHRRGDVEAVVQRFEDLEPCGQLRDIEARFDLDMFGKLHECSLQVTAMFGVSSFDHLLSRPNLVTPGRRAYGRTMAVIETITLRLTPGADITAFSRANARVEAEYLPEQSGFNVGSRVTTLDDDGTWTISLRWDSAADADASMASFMDAPATQDYLSMIDMTAMEMRRSVEIASPRARSLDHATRLYMEGIRDGNARAAVEAYTGDRYTQHSTGVRDGVEGFVEFFEPFIERNPKRDIDIVRSIVDGRFVFLMAAQSLNDGESRWVTTDLFDTDGNDKIIEHWDVIHEWGGENPGGHTQVDGATEITDLDKTEENKVVVRRLLEEAFILEPTASFDEFISSETYINHNPDAPDGIEALKEMDRMAREKGETLYYKKVHRIVGQGNFVVSFAHQVWNDIDYAAFDIFRLEDGMIVEHWDNVEVLPDPADLVNSGKF